MEKMHETKQRLIDAATELVWRKSYGAVGVEDICERAGVKKGSFYHFFVSKTQLVVEAMNQQWLGSKKRLDESFSAERLPLERLLHYFETIYRRQCDLKQECGQVLGCLFTSLGSETAKQEPLIGAKVCELISIYCWYIESALREAVVEKSIAEQDVKAKARAIFACIEGMLTQARIMNDPDVLKSLPAMGMGMIGAKVEMAEAAH